MKPFSRFLPLYRTVPLTSAFLAQPAASRASARPRSRRRAGRVQAADADADLVEQDGVGGAVGDGREGSAEVDAHHRAGQAVGLGVGAAVVAHLPPAGAGVGRVVATGPRARRVLVAGKGDV